MISFEKFKKIRIKKRYIATALIVATVVTVGVTGITASKQVKYDTKDIERCTITQVVEASGTINPVNTVSVGSTVSGLIKEIFVDYNDVVKKGQLIMLTANTGNSSGPHLHFEVRVSPYNWSYWGNDSRRDPRNYL